VIVLPDDDEEGLGFSAWVGGMVAVLVTKPLGGEGANVVVCFYLQVCDDVTCVIGESVLSGDVCGELEEIREGLVFPL
jgi:hypothetical protein